MAFYSNCEVLFGCCGGLVFFFQNIVPLALLFHLLDKKRKLIGVFKYSCESVYLFTSYGNSHLTER